jgi:transposase
MTDDPLVGRHAKRQEALDLYTTTDLGTEAIAERIGVSRSTLYNWLSAAGLSGSRRQGLPTAPSDPMAERFDEQLEEVKSLWPPDVYNARWEEVVETLAATKDVLDQLVGQQEHRWEQWNAAADSVRSEVVANRETTMREVGELRREVTELRALTAANSAVLGRIQGAVEAMMSFGAQNLENIQRALRSPTEE